MGEKPYFELIVYGKYDPNVIKNLKYQLVVNKEVLKKAIKKKEGRIAENSEQELIIKKGNSSDFKLADSFKGELISLLIKKK